MKPLLVINDVHLGVQRVAGTTPASQSEVRKYLELSMFELTHSHLDKDLCILGDLFDGFTIDYPTLLEAYHNLSSWLNRSEGDLLLVAGNHDIGKRDDRLSSFDVLAELLVSRFSRDRVKVIRDGLYSCGNVHIIPHCMNQDLFNLELEKARNVDSGFLLLHANVDNGFAEESDHSLNVDGEWLARLSKKHQLLFAHEHQHRTLKVEGGKFAVTVLGNQWPSSVSDCLAHGEAQKDGRKFAHVIHSNGSIEPIETWRRDGDFEQIDWEHLTECPARFIRIIGEATAEQAADVVNAVSKYRQRSNAYVVSNGVKIGGAEGMDELAEMTFEKVTSFDVLGALLEQLEPKEQKVVKELLA